MRINSSNERTFSADVTLEIFTSLGIGYGWNVKLRSINFVNYLTDLIMFTNSRMGNLRDFVMNFFPALFEGVKATDFGITIIY